MKTKKCRTCPTETASKPVSEFTKSTAYKDGYTRECKSCRVKASNRRSYERKNHSLQKVGSSFEIVQTEKLKKLTSRFDFRFSNKEILNLESQYIFNRNGLTI